MTDEERGDKKSDSGNDVVFKIKKHHLILLAVIIGVLVLFYIVVVRNPGPIQQKQDGSVSYFDQQLNRELRSANFWNGTEGLYNFLMANYDAMNSSLGMKATSDSNNIPADEKTWGNIYTCEVSIESVIQLNNYTIIAVQSIPSSSAKHCEIIKGNLYDSSGTKLEPIEAVEHGGNVAIGEKMLSFFVFPKIPNERMKGGSFILSNKVVKFKASSA